MYVKLLIHTTIFLQKLLFVFEIIIIFALE